MERNQYVVALEIGSTKIVGAIAEKSANAYVGVKFVAEEKTPNCVRYGCIQNVENTKQAINRIIRSLEKSIDGQINDIYVGFSGHSVHSEASEVSRELDGSSPITDMIIDRIIESETRDSFKSYEIVDVVPRTYYIDGDETRTPSGRYGSKIGIKLNLIVAKPTLKLNLDRAMKDLTAKVKGYLVTPLVIGEEILTNEEMALGCMLVDMGAETTEVIIYKDGALVYLTTLPLGGRNLTRDMTAGLTIMEETAERVKKSLTNPLDPTCEAVTIEGVNSQNASKYITARMGEIIANINKQREYAGLGITDIKTVVLIGGSSMLPGIQEMFGKVMNVKVRRGECPTNINIENHSVNKPEYIGIFSLLAKAAEIIPAGHSCLERTIYDDGPEFEGGIAPVSQPAQEEPLPRQQEKKRKKGRFSGIIDKLSSLLDENDGNDKDDS